MLDFHSVRSVFASLFPYYTWRKLIDKKTIYLTFDDGPVPGVSEWVLDTLKHYQVKATFFVVGDNVRKHPEVIHRMASEQKVANHTFHHIKGWKKSNEQYWNDIDACKDVLQNYETLNTLAYSATSKKIFRPPYGQITKAQYRMLSPYYDIIMWDVLTGDYNKHIHLEKTLKRICKKTRNGSIIVFHDSYKAEAQMKYLLPPYIEYCLKQGYQFAWL